MNELSVLITSLPSAAKSALAEVARLGFDRVDLVGTVQRSETERAALAESGLVVQCVALGRDLPAGASLDAADIAQRRTAVEAVRQQISEAALLGASVGYVVPGKDASNLAAFADSCGVLAPYARQRGVRFCVEHFPCSALASAAVTLKWLEAIADVQMVLDLGHCLISHEDPAGVVAVAGRRLGYVQLDDNDGVNDVHWPLLTGALSEPVLRSLLSCLQETTFGGGVALELNGRLDDAIGNLQRSRDVVLRASVAA